MVLPCAATNFEFDYSCACKVRIVSFRGRRVSFLILVGIVVMVGCECLVETWGCLGGCSSLEFSFADQIFIPFCVPGVTRGCLGFVRGLEVENYKPCDAREGYLVCGAEPLYADGSQTLGAEGGDRWVVGDS